MHKLARNRFLFEGLPPGDYDVIVSGDIALPGSVSSLPEVKRRMTVSAESEAEITIVIELSAKNN